MKIDWFDFWLAFSWILLFFLFIGLLIRFFHWLKFRRELSYMKQQKIKDIVKFPNNISPTIDESFKEVSNFKQEIDSLMKDVYFDLYDKNLNSDSFDKADDFWLEKLLDGKILNLIKEKDYLLNQKDMLILSLEERNRKTLKEIINKIFLLVKEKDKMLYQKDSLIMQLRWKIQEVELLHLDNYISNFQSTEKKVEDTNKNNKNHIDKQLNSNDFVNVNFVGWK